MSTKPVMNSNGGVVSNQAPGYPTTLPPDLQAIVEAAVPNMITRAFRQASNPQRTALEVKTSTQLGGQIPQRLENIGLVDSLNVKVSASITLTNVNVAAQDANCAPDFPFNILSNQSVQINANNQIISASPYAMLHENFVRRRYRIQDLVEAATFTGDTILSVSTPTVGSSVKAGSVFPGSDNTDHYTITCKAADDTVINASFIVRIPFVLNEQSMVGLLPLQNNTTQVSLISTVNPVAIGANGIFDSAHGDISFKSISVTVTPTQNFWTVPANPALYQSLVANSFQIVELPNNPINNTGVDAIKYIAQLETYLLRTWFIMRDSNGDLLTTLKNIINNVKVYYNAVVPVYNEYYETHRAEQYNLYGTRFGPGVVLWDGNSTLGLPNAGDDCAWLDMFQTANPSFRMDIAAGSIANLPGSYSAVEVRQVPAIIQPVTR